MPATLYAVQLYKHDSVAFDAVIKLTRFPDI